MGGQIELFRPDTDDARLAVLKAYLRDRGWVNARTIAADIKLNDRDARALAEASAGAILSGQQGYKLTSQATPDEVHHATAWLESQARKMAQRAQRIRQYFHRSAYRSSSTA
jgi:hypothetical protein